MAKQLLLDTTAKYLVVGLSDENKVLAKIQYVAWQRQSEFTIQEVKNILDKTGSDINEIKRIVVSNGPGSYTGIRIALTIAKILGFCLDIPVCVLSSLQTIAGAKGKRIALIDARSKRAYIGIYKDGKQVIKDQVLPLDDIQELIKKYPDYELVGDTFLLGIENKEIDYVDNMFELSKIVEDYPNIDALVPVYLKEAL